MLGEYRPDCGSISPTVCGGVGGENRVSCVRHGRIAWGRFQAVHDEPVGCVGSEGLPQVPQRSRPYFAVVMNFKSERAAADVFVGEWIPFVTVAPDTAHGVL